MIEFANALTNDGIHIASPISGKVSQLSCPLTTQMGQGVQITPTSDKIIAPFHGKIVQTNRLYGQVVIQAKNKLTLVCQLPFDVAESHGLGIKIHVSKGQVVNKNEPLVSFNLYKLKQQHPDIRVNIFWLNATRLERIVVPHRHVESGADPLFTLIKKKN